MERLATLAMIVSMTLAACAQNDSELGRSKLRPVVLNSETCTLGTNYESEQYRIVHVSIEDPFAFVYSIGSKSHNMQQQLTQMLENHLFTYQLVRTEAFALIEKARFAPSDSQSIAVRLQRLSVENCDATAKTLDLRYQIYSTDPPQFMGGATEAQHTAETAPQVTAGLAHGGTPFQLTPSAGYSRSFGFFGGGRLEFVPSSPKLHELSALTVEGQGSQFIRLVSGSANGSTQLHAWIQHVDWRLTYTNSSVPGGPARLSTGSLSGQTSIQTKPFWNGSTFARVGGLLQGGNMQSVVPAALLPPNTIQSAGFGSLKTYVGLSSRTDHNTISASYGLELASISPIRQIDWRKQIGDISDEFWIDLSDHKPLEIESHVTVGALQIPQVVPLSARYFGGNTDHFFIPGDAWQIRDEPVIRAIPANQFYLTAQGAGAESFTSINLTFSYPLLSYPIMPKEVTSDPEIDKLLKGQIISATSVEQNYYAWKDPHFSDAMKQLPELKQSLDLLSQYVNTAAATNPNRLQDAFADCISSIQVADFDIGNAIGAKGSSQYGDLSALLPIDSDDLQSTLDTCSTELNSTLKDPQIDAAVKAVANKRTSIIASFDQIDQKGAARKAANDTAFVSKTLSTLFRDINIYSIGPVVVMDIARIGPSNPSSGGERFGPGGGVRLELASYVNFTAGYAVNIGRRSGEDRGAIFFSIGIRELFH
jgi:hypothetical protein